MNNRFSLLTFLILVVHFLDAQPYPLAYENDFEQENPLADFEFSDPEAWKISDSTGNRSLELYRASEYEARVRSPFNIARLTSARIGSFVLEADLRQTGREYGHRDMCIFFGMKDATNFYYVHMASVADPNAHNIFLVNDEPRRNIATKTTEGVDWGDGWNHIKIERNISEGTIKVYFNDMETPIMEATDTHFEYGYIGFGSFDDTGMIDNVKLYGKKKNKKSGFFR